MVNRDDRSEIIEQGDIFFFYRPKVDTQEVEDINPKLWTEILR
jgi:hypothetical protein